MQQDSSTQTTNYIDDQNKTMVKTRYRYFTRHGLFKNSNDLQKQMMRRINPKSFSFQGDINKTSNEDQNVRTFKDLLSVIQSSKRISKLKLESYR